MPSRKRKLPPAFQEAVSRALASDPRPRAERMTLVLPFPPSANTLFPHVFTPDGRVVRVKSKRVKAYYQAVAQVVGLWLNSHGLRPPAPPWRLSLVLYPADNEQRVDTTNCFKAPEDAVMAAIGEDDRRVREAHAVMADADGYPRLVLTLETIKPQTEDRPCV